MITQSKKINEWVDEMAAHFSPQKIQWCNGSQQEYDLLCSQLVDKGTFIKLHKTKRPDSFACFSDPSDVARVEDRTFICSRRKTDAGPTNNWMDPAEMKKFFSSVRSVRMALERWASTVFSAMPNCEAISF